jgi:beta-glucosidase
VLGDFSMTTSHYTLSQMVSIFIVAFVFTVPVSSQTKTQLSKYKDPSVPVEERITDLLFRLTIEEKIAQLQSSMKRNELEKVITSTGLGGISPIFRSFTASEAAEKTNAIQKIAVEKSRLGIPVIIHDEGLHGLIGNKVTSFPQAIGLAATWNPELVSKAAAAIGKESRSRGIRQLLSPTINIVRDVRWGRVGETYGEDSFLQSKMGVAFCKAIENEGVVTTPKHFIANNGDGGRDSYPIHLSERELREVYFPPFKACIQEAGSQSIMSSYNAIDGIPTSANPWLLTEILRKDWGFQGFVVSDYGSVTGIKEKHFVAATPKEAAIKAVEAGLDMELPNIEFYGTPLVEAAKEGSVSMTAIDAAVRNILRAKFKLGLFEHPYVDSKQADAINDSPENRALAREAGRQAIVLLRNENHVLPLKKEISSIAVLGPNADVAQLGDYSGFGMKTVSILEGIKNAIGQKANVQYIKGCDVGFAALSPIPSECLVPPDAKLGEHGLKGEYFTNPDLTGKPIFTRIDKQVHFEWAMGSPDKAIPVDHYSVRWTGKLVPKESGIYAIGGSTDDGLRLYIDGKLLIDSWFSRGATLDVVNLKLEAGHSYDVKIEFYENDGWSYASFDWEMKQDIDPLIQAAVDAAKKSDAAVIVTGIIEGEGYDRANLDLPGKQEQLIKAVAATGTPTIVVLLNGSAITMRNWIDSVSAVVEAWYPGEEGGNAVADVLFGDYNPGGKLPLSFPQFVGQVPLYYNHKPTGRGDDYSDMNGKPQFPFGFGLSYTSFSYSNLVISPLKIVPSGLISVSVDIQNTGAVLGDEVVQLYTHDPFASVTRPVKELKGFKRISLNSGEKKTITFTLSKVELSFLDRSMKSSVEPGSIEVLIGSSSDDIRVSGSFEVISQ